MRTGETSKSALWRDLIGLARQNGLAHMSSIHGDLHWRAVSATALVIQCIHPQADAEIGFAFGIVHDCLREDDGADPEHGQRAGAYVRKSALIHDILGASRAETLAIACDRHHLGALTEDATVGCCFDADRFNLVRLGIRPQEGYFSLPWGPRDFARMIQEVQALCPAPPDWTVMLQDPRLCLI